MATFAFKNKGGHWASRYSFEPTNYSRIDRKMITSTDVLNAGQGIAGESGPIGSRFLWDHSPFSDPQLAADQKSKFYNDVTKSSFISFSFNENVSANKIYKNFSLEGSFKNTTPAASFLANDSSNKTQQRSSEIFDFVEKAATLHANIGKNSLISRANVTPVGILKSACQVLGGVVPLHINSKSLYNNPTLKAVNLNPQDYVDELQAAGQEYLFDPLGITSHRGSYESGIGALGVPRWASGQESPYIFFEVDFFANWQPSSSKIKYVLTDQQPIPGIDDLISSKYGKDFYSITAPFNSYGIPENPNLFSSTTPSSKIRFNIENAPSKVKLQNYVSYRYPNAGEYEGYSPGFPGFPLNDEAAIRPEKNPRDKLDGLLVVNDYGEFSPEYRPTDLDQDGLVDVGDLLMFLVQFNNPEFNPDVDFNGDGGVGVADLLELLGDYGTTEETSGLTSKKIQSKTVGSVSAVVLALNNVLDVLTRPIVIYAITPGEIDGQPARGNYADMTVSFNGDFELDVVNLEYEPTTLDHSR